MIQPNSLYDRFKPMYNVDRNVTPVTTSRLNDINLSKLYVTDTVPNVKPTLFHTDINNSVFSNLKPGIEESVTAKQNTIVGDTDFSTASMYLNGNSRPTSAFSEPVVLQQGLGSTDLGRALATRELLRAQEDTVPVPGPTQVNESIKTQPTQVVQAVQKPVQRHVVANKPQPRQVHRQQVQPTQPVYIPEPTQVQHAHRPTHKERLAMLDSPSFGVDGAGIDW